MIIRKVIELFYHQTVYGGYYATEISVKCEEVPIQRLRVTFELNGAERIEWGTVRALSEASVCRHHNIGEIAIALRDFFDDRKTTVKEYMKKINTLD